MRAAIGLSFIALLVICCGRVWGSGVENFITEKENDPSANSHDCMHVDDTTLSTEICSVHGHVNHDSDSCHNHNLNHDKTAGHDDDHHQTHDLGHHHDGYHHDQHHHHNHNPDSHNGHQHKHERMNTHTHELETVSTTRRRKADRFLPAIWIESLFATALVGAAPVVVLLFVPLGIGSNDDTQKSLLRTFLSFAAGGLLGDALLHLLPHSIPSVNGHDRHHLHVHADHAHSVDDLAVWLWTIAGIISFLMLEKFVRTKSSSGHSHGICDGDQNKPDSNSYDPRSGPKERVASTKDNKLSHKKRAAANESKVENHTTTRGPIIKSIAPAGYLNLAADFSHNFTDGLAIGATFLRGSGWRTTFAMLLHELPHEIGDFAILIQSGFTRREAMYSQLLTALGAMIGTVIGLLMEGTGDSTSAWISPFTAGGFIYIACVSIMPELLEDCSFRQSLNEGLAICLGVGLMIFIAANE